MSDTSQGPDWWKASDGKWYPPQQDMAGLATCRYCGGEIQAGVSKCRHCGEWLDSSKASLDRTLGSKVLLWIVVLGLVGVGVSLWNQMMGDAEADGRRQAEEFVDCVYAGRDDC